ncbi:MAG: translation elongation factor Ts [Candidatus Doudnabacteria bacterium]|nr:translation elongation factor Ts [Candidatus Doudnabacteria bacterium]
MNITTEDVKKLREQTGAGMMDAKRALEEAGNFDEAASLLRKRGHATLSKKSARTVGQGLIASYIHAGGKIGVLVELNCETDFVARNDEFVKLANEIAMHIAASDPEDVAAMLNQPYVRNPEQQVKDLIAETVGKLGENIRVRRFARFVLGD